MIENQNLINKAMRGLIDYVKREYNVDREGLRKVLELRDRTKIDNFYNGRAKNAPKEWIPKLIEWKPELEGFFKTDSDTTLTYPVLPYADIKEELFHAQRTILKLHQRIKILEAKLKKQK